MKITYPELKEDTKEEKEEKCECGEEHDDTLDDIDEKTLENILHDLDDNAMNALKEKVVDEEKKGLRIAPCVTLHRGRLVLPAKCALRSKQCCLLRLPLLRDLPFVQRINARANAEKISE